MAKIGFTGTQRGMTDKQRHSVIRFLMRQGFETIELHHGDCIGADCEIHNFAIMNRLKSIVIHPPIYKHKRCIRKDDPKFLVLHFGKSQSIPSRTRPWPR